MLELRLFGGFAVHIDDREVSDSAWRRRKARTVVKLLALAPKHTLHRDEVIEAMWPGTNLAQGGNNLHQVLFAARRALGGDDAYLQLRDEFLMLGPDVVVDVDEFESAAARADHTGALDDLRAAVDAYGGELLPADRYEPWCEPVRDELRRRYHRLVAELVVAHLKAGDHGVALDLLRPLHEADPVDEDIARLLIRAQLAAGRRLVAVSTYHRLVETLRDELGVAPEEATLELGRQLSSQAESGTTSVTPHNLPLRLSSFVGRGRELREAGATLKHSRLLTLTGTGGCGKSRLGVELAELQLETFPGGVYLVELAPLSDSEAVARSVAATLGVQQPPGIDPTQAVAQHISGRGQPVLLVIDNCEHLLDAAASLSHQLLTTAPNLTVVATSRQPLLLPGEVVWRVPSLSLPDSRGQVTLSALRTVEAVRLFVERAATAAPPFELTERNAGDVATLCRRLDGLPLALELAAARLRSMPIGEIVARLDDRFGLLVGGSRVALTRQQTLRATVDWSYELLTEPERVLLRRLAVFAGGFSIGAAEAVCADEPLTTADVADLLAALVERSLIVPDESDSSARYHLLETIREYAAERLRAAGERDAVRRRHASWVLALAEDAAPELTHTGRSGALRRIGADHGNVRAAFSSLMRTDPPTALLLGALLWRYWLRSGRLAEGLQALNAALDAVPEHTPVRARALLGVCGLSNRGGRISEWNVQAVERVRIFEELGDHHGLSNAYYYVGVQAWLTQELPRSLVAFRAARDIAIEHGLAADEASARYGIASVAAIQCRYDEAEATLADVLDMVERLVDTAEPVAVLNVAPLVGRPPGSADHRRVVFEETAAPFTEPCGILAVGYVTANLGSIARENGDYELARDRFERALRIFEDADDDGGTAIALARLGNLAGVTQEMPRAHALLDAALRTFRRMRDARGIGQTIANLGYWTAISGDMRRGLDMVERAEAMFRENGDMPGLYTALSHLGALSLIDGDQPTARRALTEGVGIQRMLGTRTQLGWSLVSLAEALRRAGDDPSALIAEAREHFAYTSRPDGLAHCEQLGKAL